MNAGNLYQDRWIACNDQALVIRCYYFPFCGVKVIPYCDVKGIEVYALSFLTGKGRIWGGTLSHWLNLDWRRPWKKQGIILELGDSVAPVITPDDVPAVVRILEQKTGRRAVRREKGYAV